MATNETPNLNLWIYFKRFPNFFLCFELTWRLLCSTKRPISGEAGDRVRKITTHKSSWERCDFSEFLWPSWNNVNSASVGSKTVNKTHDIEHNGCKVP